MNTLDLPPVKDVENVSARALERLTEFLKKNFGATSPIELRQITEGTNKQTHLVAIDATQSRFGLKAVSEHRSEITKELFTNDHIILIAELSQILDAPVPIECVKAKKIEGLGPLGSWDFVARKWHGLRLDKIGDEEMKSIKATPERFLDQYGQWFAFGLIFALCDGKVKNWTWDPEDKTLGRFDVECSFYRTVGPADLSDGLRPFNFRSKIKQHQQPEYDYFAQGMQAMIERFQLQREDVESRLAAYDFSRGFLSAWSWASKPAEEFIAEATASLPT